MFIQEDQNSAFTSTIGMALFILAAFAFLVLS